MIGTSQMILVIAPHADDAELGAGASIAKWCDDGCHVVIAVMTDRGESESYEEETKAAIGKLSPRNAATLLMEYFTTFMLSAERSAVLRKLEQFRRQFKPDVVCVPSRYTNHQDHFCIYEESCRCFKGTTLITYEIIRSDVRFRPTLFVSVEPDHVARKVSAVACYSSQTSKAYTQAAAIEGLAAVRGAQCDSPTGLAEAFAIEWLCCK